MLPHTRITLSKCAKFSLVEVIQYALRFLKEQATSFLLFFFNLGNIVCKERLVAPDTFPFIYT